MKNLKKLKDALILENLDIKQLTRKEQKEINGGRYESKEECMADCHGADGGWGIYTGYGGCEYIGGGWWDCYDS